MLGKGQLGAKAEGEPPVAKRDDSTLLVVNKPHVGTLTWELSEQITQLLPENEERRKAREHMLAIMLQMTAALLAAFAVADDEMFFRYCSELQNTETALMIVYREEMLRDREAPDDDPPETA
jgi:hypothetical protein